MELATYRLIPDANEGVPFPSGNKVRDTNGTKKLASPSSLSPVLHNLYEDNSPAVPHVIKSAAAAEQLIEELLGWHHSLVYEVFPLQKIL